MIPVMERIVVRIRRLIVVGVILMPMGSIG